MFLENINKKVNSIFLFVGLKWKFWVKFSGVKESDLILSEVNEVFINEVLVI